jgi:anion-transporting  ArsA/GET3 family ATPase
MPERSWLSWLQGLSLPPSPNETPRTRKKRLLKTPRNRLWPSEEKNWHQAKENESKERAAEIEAHLLAAYEAEEEGDRRRLRSLERRHRLALAHKEDNSQVTIDLPMIRIERMLNEMNTSAKRKAALRKAVRNALGPTEGDKLQAHVASLGRRSRSTRRH